jgi:hypothetical protein
LTPESTTTSINIYSTFPTNLPFLPTYRYLLYNTTRCPGRTRPYRSPLLRYTGLAVHDTILDCHPRYSSSRSGRGENPPERQEVAWRGTGTLGHWDWGSGFKHWLAPCHPPFTVKPALTKMPHRTRFTLCDRLPTVQPIPAFTLSLFSLPLPSLLLFTFLFPSLEAGALLQYSGRQTT